MGFVVLHMEKAHGSDSGTTAHIERFIIPKNADPTRTHLNRKLVAYPNGIKDRSAAIQRRLEEAGLTRKIGNNQVRAISYQDTYAVAMAKYGLQRGIDGSKARHKSTQQYYNETKKLADNLKAEVVDLQHQKETAQEELRRKFRTEKAGVQVMKDPTDGTKLVLAIDRKPIAEWFKEQFNKLRQNIHRPIQPQRKGRGMKL